MQNVGAQDVAVKVFFRATSWVEGYDPTKRDTPQTSPTTPRVAVFSPGPPGVGKSTAAINYLRVNDGRLLSPSTALAREQLARAQAIAKLVGADPDRARQQTGLGRGCNYSEDTWAAKGITHAQAMCNGCPFTATCRAHRQHFDTPREIYGTHQQAQWTMAEPKLDPQVKKIRAAKRKLGRSVEKPFKLTNIDEMPYPVEQTTLHLLEIAMIRCPTNELWSWMQATKLARLEFIEAWDAAVHQMSFLEGMQFGLALDLKLLFAEGSWLRRAAEKLYEVLIANPVPLPNPEWARPDLSKPEWWPHVRWMEFFHVLLRQELRDVPVADRPPPHCTVEVRLSAYNANGRLGNPRETFEIYQRWTPPAEPHMISDSTAPYSLPIYDKIYGTSGHERRNFFCDAALPTENIRAVHYETTAFTKRALFDDFGKFTKAGECATLRALNILYTHVEEERWLRFKGRKRNPGYKIGLIAHRKHLEALGFQFDSAGQLQFDEDGNAVRAPFKDPTVRQRQIETMLANVQAHGQLVVGYHYNTRGSNRWAGCSVIAHLDTPKQNLGVLRSEARCLGMDGDEYVKIQNTVEAVQEVFRCRPLTASAKDPKTILWFAQVAAEGGFNWRHEEWAQGGRVPSQAFYFIQHAIQGWSRDCGAFPASLVGLVDPSHDVVPTPNKGHLLELLRSIEYRDDGTTTPAHFDLYRRAAKELATLHGMREYKVPTRGGVMRVHATSAETARAFWKGLETSTKISIRDNGVLKVMSNEAADLHFESICVQAQAALDQVHPENEPAFDGLMQHIEGDLAQILDRAPDASPQDIAAAVTPLAFDKMPVRTTTPPHTKV